MSRYVDDGKRIDVFEARSRDVGGCNGCDRHMTPAGEPDYRVTVIRSGTEIRLCASCMDTLMARIKSVKRHRHGMA